MSGHVFKNMVKFFTVVTVIAVVIDSVSGPVQQHYRQYTKASMPQEGTSEYSDMIKNARQKIFDAD